MYAAISGLSVHQTMLDVTANNLANVDTIGYKAQRTTFVDQLSQQLRAATTMTATSGGSNPVQVGLGVQLGSIDNLMGQGSMQSTGNTLDLMIQGDGFFQVGSGNAGAVPPTLPASYEYTRAGNFTLNSSGYLTTQSGEYVMGQAQAGAISASNPLTYLQIPPGSTSVAIGQNGAVTYVDTSGNTQTAGYISLVSFPNEAGLQRDGGSLWSQSSSSGTPMSQGSPQSGNLGSTISGELEQSNVDLATEFTNMITAERGFQANSRVITTADQMLQTLVSMGQ
ncbi:MAG TPA: flagellar hook-basal body complex protein [Solirubrobacteraceae bacterium]|nr:flagellar hook-basal body complex protein [Solirubrobacteraceae bacterium]